MYTLPCLSGPLAQARPDGAALGSKTTVEVMNISLFQHVQVLYTYIRCRDCSKLESRVQRQLVLCKTERPTQEE